MVIPSAITLSYVHATEPPCRLTHVSELGLDEFGRWDGGLMNLTSLHLSANQLRIVPR